ncbi:hypothetical protein COOONC_22345 [Cooperia oncophora]
MHNPEFRNPFRAGSLLGRQGPADQAVEVCDESKVVQYVNRAYESVTGCLRGEVVGCLAKAKLVVPLKKSQPV